MKKVLVVDDDEMVVAGLTEFLKLEQFDPSGAFDRASAEELIAGEFFPIVVADLRLRSEEEGLALLDAVARISPRTRVAAMTGYSTPEIERELLARGATMVLFKPFDPSKLAALLHEMLAVIEGDVAAVNDVETVYAESRRALESIARRRYLLDADDVEDVVQEAWLLFLERQRDVRNPKAWLAGTVANLCRDTIARRCRTRDRSAELHEDIPAAAIGYDDTFSVRRALEQVDPRSRQLCTLLGIERRSYVEVSESLQIPLGSVGPLYQRAKERMRRLLE